MHAACNRVYFAVNRTNLLYSERAKLKLKPFKHFFVDLSRPNAEIK